MSKLLTYCVPAALLLTACGSTAVEVTVDGTPATSGPRDDQADRAAFDQMGRFLQAANTGGVENARAVTVPGITLLRADQPSTGPNSISVLVAAADVAVAIKSESGTCLWYAWKDSADRYGTGEPCTASAALTGSAPTVPAGSPWHLVLDQTSGADAQGKPARAAVRNALIAAKTYYSDQATYNELTPAVLQQIEPMLQFVAGDIASPGPEMVSVTVSGNTFAAAARGGDGTCYWIADDALNGVGTRYGRGEPCTGTAALAAADPAW